jgi:hypothetical protein
MAGFDQARSVISLFRRNASLFGRAAFPVRRLGNFRAGVAQAMERIRDFRANQTPGRG